MISESNVILGQCDSVFDVIFFKTMYNKAINRFSLCDIIDNQCFNKCNQPQLSSADNTSHHLDYSGYLLTKTSSSNKQ